MLLLCRVKCLAMVSKSHTNVSERPWRLKDEVQIVSICISNGQKMRRQGADNLRVSSQIVHIPYSLAVALTIGRLVASEGAK